MAEIIKAYFVRIITLLVISKKFTNEGEQDVRKKAALYIRSVPNYL